MIYLILAALLYTGVVLTGTAASRNANTNLVGAISNVISTIAPLLVVLPALTRKSFTSHKFGIWMAVANGLIVGLFVLALNKSFATNKIGIVTPVIYGGTILLSTILSYFIFNEKISILEGIGLSLVLVGLGFVCYARAIAA